jgi:hypothetical protein
MFTGTPLRGLNVHVRGTWLFRRQKAKWRVRRFPTHESAQNVIDVDKRKWLLDNFPPRTSLRPSRLS